MPNNETHGNTKKQEFIQKNVRLPPEILNRLEEICDESDFYDSQAHLVRVGVAKEIRFYEEEIQGTEYDRPVYTKEEMDG